MTRNNLPLLNLKLRYETPSNSNSTPQYGGNISEWEWSRNDSETNMYSFGYDPLARLADSRHYLNASPSNTLEEKDISYDLNGNMLTMTQVDESGDEDDLTYSYSGNQLTSSTYDSNGNMIYDAASGLSIEWNHLNLIKKVSDNNGILVNYSYLADGTKVSAVDADGEGLEYRGSLTFRRSSDGTLTPESIAFSGGRIVAVTGSGGAVSFVVNHYVTDHLGSVRAVVSGSPGQVAETNDYYAFGSRWDRSGSLVDQSNRYRYNGKEEQATFGTPYSDYGARQYSSASGRWLAVDPLAEKYYGISPYAFCNNNPIRYEDVDGEDWIDKAVGYIVGGATNVVPGTGFIRDWYSPDNSSDYNSALKHTDEAAAVLGTSMVKAGTGTIAAGGVLATAGAGVTVSTVGAGVVVGAPAVVVGAEIAGVGAATAATGGVMVMNSSKNKSDVYERGNKSSEITFRQGQGDKARLITTKIPEGYRKVKFRSKEMPVFYNGKNYLSPDRDGHNGGVWKMAKKKHELENRSVRMGTYDKDLKRIGN